MQEAEKQASQLEAGIKSEILLELGIKPQNKVMKQKALVTHFKYLPHWNIRANQVLLQEHILLDGKFPVVLGKDILVEVKHGCSNPPAEKPTALEILKRIKNEGCISLSKQMAQSKHFPSVF